MTVLRFLAAACVALALAACSIGEPIPQATTYSVDLPQPAPATSRRAETLRMGHVRVAPAFAGNMLVYRTDDVVYTADFYNAFIAQPGALLGGVMAAWLDRAGPFKSVAQPGAPGPAAFVLEAAVSELYGDFRPNRPPEAVVTIQFMLVDLRGVTPKVAMERTIGRRVALSAETPEALMRGYSQALEEILRELAPRLATAAT